jgi:hypothetical protein
MGPHKIELKLSSLTDALAVRAIVVGPVTGKVAAAATATAVQWQCLRWVTWEVYN